MRKVEIKNDTILESIKAKEVIVNKILAIQEEADKLNERGKEIQVEYDDLSSQVTREDEKVRPELLEEAKKIELADFEEVSRVYLGKDEDDGKLFIEVADRLEEFKEFYKQKKDEKNNSGDTTSDRGASEPDVAEPAEGSK